MHLCKAKTNFKMLVKAYNAFLPTQPSYTCRFMYVHPLKIQQI